MTDVGSQVETFVELIRRASTDLPADVNRALEKGRAGETKDGLAERALGTILENVELARSTSAPICQDTGTPVVWIHHPVGVSTRKLAADFTTAVEEATKRTYLRPNAVDTLTGRNTGTGHGRGIPFLHFEEWDEPRIEVRMILKGGGSENVGAQYKLPDGKLRAGRDLEGVRRAVLDAVFQAQGKGCAPGVLGVCIGGDRVSAYEMSKRQILRPIVDTNPIPELAELEERILREANMLGVGPMGFGGRTTLLAVKIGVLDRLPACYFVTVTYMCWADRKAAVSIDAKGEATWLS
ncbi:MAG: fumarate hydratase [Thermoanaerobaculales bacterium]|jgi:fumarate hydratase class I|nr:fumarate hydratase [Thermoanaerobaculales bacterium]